MLKNRVEKRRDGTNEALHKCVHTFEMKWIHKSVPKAKKDNDNKEKTNSNSKREMKTKKHQQQHTNTQNEYLCTKDNNNGKIEQQQEKKYNRWK